MQRQLRHKWFIIESLLEDLQNNSYNKEFDENLGVCVLNMQFV